MMRRTDLSCLLLVGSACLFRAGGIGFSGEAQR